MVVVSRTMSWSIRDNEGGTAIRHRPFLGSIFYFIVGDFVIMNCLQKKADGPVICPNHHRKERFL